MNTSPPRRSTPAASPVPGSATRGPSAGSARLVCVLNLLLATGLLAQEIDARRLAELKSMSLAGLAEVTVATVYGASKHEQKITEAPSSVTIVTQEEIKQSGHRTLADILGGVRGFYVNSDRNYSFIGVRGVNRPGDYGGGVLLTINGHRLNDPVADEAFNGGEFPLDVGLIDRVEVIRGPGSSLYGNNAFFTVINVITRRSGDLDNGEVSFSAGSFDAYGGRASVSHRFTNGVELLLSATRFDSRGHRSLYYSEFDTINGGRAINLDRESRQQAFLSVSYQDFTLEGVYGDRVKSFPTGAYGTLFNVAPNWSRDQRAYLELRYRHEAESAWVVDARLSYDHYFFDGYGPYDGADTGRSGEAVWNHDTSLAKWLGGEVQVSRKFSARHRVTFGLEGRKELTLRQHSYWVDPHLDIDDVASPGNNFGAYAQDEITLRPGLLLNAGLRFDHYSSFGSTVNPRLAMIFNPSPTTTLKALYGQAYRAPNAYEFDYNSVGYVSNHDLKPETIRSYELVWEQQLAQPLRFSASLFFNQIANQIVQQDESADPAVGGFVFRNVGETEVKGGEVELEATWKSGVRGRVSYTYAQAADRATGARLSNSPRHVGKFNVSAPLHRGKVYAGLEVLALSARQSATTTDTTPGFVTANVTLFSQRLRRGYEVSAGIYNVFDRRYADPAGPDFTQQFIPQDGRTFRAKLTRRF